MKRFLSLIFTAILFFGISNIASAKSFDDVPKNNRFYEDIEYLNGKGLLSKQRYFELNRPATRGEVSEILVKALNLEAPQQYVPLKDIPTNHPSAPIIQAAVEADLLKGFPDGTFRPNAPITRAQMALILTRAFNYDKQRKDIYLFEDVKKGTELYDAVHKLKFYGIVLGTKDWEFSPDNLITRGQMAAMVARALRYEEVPFMQGDSLVYMVGDRDDELPPGEYLIKRHKNKELFYMTSRNGNFSKEDMLAHYRGDAEQTYVHLYKGQGIVYEGQLIPVKQYTPKKQTMIKKKGTYKIGYDIDEGSFLAAPYYFHNNGKIAYFYVYADANGRRMVYKSSEQHHPYEVTLKAGQYVYMDGIELSHGW